MLPQVFLERMQGLLGSEYEEFLVSFDHEKYQALRLNPLKLRTESGRTDDSTVIEEKIQQTFRLHPVPWADNGYYYTKEDQPGKHPWHEAGLYYIQEPSAMAPVTLLSPQPGERILDLCAAPGGKSTQIASAMEGEGLLVTNEIHPARAKILSENVERMGIRNACVLNETLEHLADIFEEYFDRILVDAPCSGEGMFRKDKKMVKAWEEHGPEFFSNLQRNIILQAARMLKPGGLMLYSTCTFDPSENERIIEHLKKEYPEFHVLPMENYEGFCPGIPEVTEEKDEELKKTVRIFPHKMKGEGHYVALLQKGEPLPAKELKPKKKSGKIPADLEEFMKQVTWKLDGSRLDIHGERIYYMPEGLPDVRGIRFLRTGLLLGELKKNRFEPSQAFAMCLKKDEYAQIIDLPCEDERVRRYLKGETLDVDDLTERKAKGWYLVCVDGFPLGWGKVSNGTLKNKYLPGWRLC